MMKLSYEERTGLKTELSKILLLIILISDFITPQIPFKGFCKLNSFDVDSGYTRIFSFNYDQDEYSDLLVYNPVGSKSKLYRGKAGLNFELIKEISFPQQPSRIEPIIASNNMIEGYAFTSRKSRSFGIYKFSNQGNPELINSIKFNYYPEHLSVADVDNDGNQEFLLSGNSFDGLSLINQNGGRLEENKILLNQTFINAQFIDLNSDGVKDIVALNSTDDSIHFLFNNTRAEFTELREIYLNENVMALKVFDINYDSYPDIIISTTSSIKIYFGDATHSYQQIISIKTLFPVNDFVIGDFNRDGYFDFNCLSVSEGKIFTFFAKDFYTFYKEMIHTESKGTVEIIPFFSKFVYGSAYINKSGSINILSKITSMSNDQTLALSVNPSTINKFDFSDNGINDLLFIDNYDQSIKFILRDATGFPEKLFSISLNENHKEIIEFRNSKFVKTFYCYSLGKRIIESVEVDFEKFTYKRDYFYADGPIEDLIILPDASGNAEIFILFSKDRSLNFEIYSKTSLRYSNKTYKKISYNWFSPAIVSAKEMLIGFWSLSKGFIEFNLADLKASNYEIKQISKIKYGDISIVSESNNSGNYYGIPFLSLITGEGKISLLNAKDNFTIYPYKSDKYDFRITDKNQLFFDKTNSIFVNDKAGKTLYRIFPLKAKNQLIIEKVFDDIDISNFIVTNLDQRNNHIVYINNNFISIKQIPK